MPEADVRISNASLGEQLADKDGRTVVKISYSKSADESDEEEDAEEEPSIASFVLCSLTGGKAENAQVNLILEAETAYKFELVGKNPVSLSGNYIDQINSDQPPLDGSDFDSDEDDAYDLRDVSSDVEMHPDDLDGVDSDASRFEEVEEGVEGATKPSKRTREVDDADKEPKAKTDKKNKKLKKENGEAVPVGKGELAEQEKKEKEEKKEKKEKKEKTAKTNQEVKELPGGLKYQDATIGTGPQAKKGDKLQMRYIGKLMNGKVFDKNVKGKPFTFHLGGGEVIKGWDQGLAGMRVGGERTLTCPPNLAYGKSGNPTIPGNSTLIFEVKLLAIN